MSGKAAVAAAPGVPASARRLVQSLKEIVNCPDAEIYATLKECDMDPDATVNRLLTQDTFHEVKSKRDKKKETKEPGESRPRAVNNTSARGSRVSSDRGPRSSYYQSSSNENQAPRVKATTVKESETNSQHTSSILGPATGGASNLNQKPTAPSPASNTTTHTSNGLMDGPPLSTQPTPSGFQSAWSGGGLHGHLSMADVVKMGRPQATKSAAAPVAPVVSTDRSYAAQYPAMPSHAPKMVPAVSPETVQSQSQPPSSQVRDTDPSPIAASTGNNAHDSSITDDWTIVDQPSVVAADYSAGPGVSSLEGDIDEQHYGQVEASDEQVQVEDSGIDTELDDALNNAAAYQSQGHSFEPHEVEEAEEDAAASAAGKFQQLNLHEEEQLMNSNAQEENPAVIIPNHLQVSNAECARLSFGSFTSGAFSGMFNPKTLEAHAEVASAVEEPSTVDQPDNRNEEFYNNGPLDQSPTENAGSIMGARVETLDMPSVSASEPDVLRNEAPDAVHGLQYNVPSVSSQHGFPSAAQPSGVEFGYSQGGTQLQNLSAFSSLLQANSLHGSLLPPAAQPARDFDLSFSQLVTSQSMPTKYMQSVPSTSGSTISVQEAAKQQGVYSNQQPMAQTQTQNQNQTQNLASTNVPTGPPLPQPLAVHPYSQPTLPLGPFTNLIGYPFLPQSYTYLPSTAFQQPYTGNGAFHQSAAAVPNAGIKYTTVPQYKSSVSSSTSVPQQASSVVSGYGAFVGSGNVPGNFAVNPGSGSGASTSLGFDEALSSQYKDMSPYMSLQQSENPAMWLHGAAGSRTLSTMPASNFYSYQGQTQHGGFRQGQQPSQLNSLGYPNFYHSQIPGGAQDHHHHHQQHQHQHQHQHQQNPGDASLASGAQAATQQSSHQLWQNSY